MAQYVAQMLPDREGAEALRKLMHAALDLERTLLPVLTPEQIDALHELYAKLSRDMREKERH